MANNNETHDQWVDPWIDGKLKSLNAPGVFQPDAADAGARLRIRQMEIPRQTRWTWVAVAAALCLAPLAFPAPRAFAQRGLNRVLNMVLRIEVAEIRPAAADFTLTDANGKIVRLTDYKGQVVLLNFWATWCAPCKTEIPWFMEFEKTYKDRGFTVLGVAFEEDGWTTVRPYIASQGMNYPVMISAPEQLPKPYSRIEMLPTTYLIDRQGRIAGTHDSLATKAVYEEWIRKLLDN